IEKLKFTMLSSVKNRIESIGVIFWDCAAMASSKANDEKIFFMVVKLITVTEVNKSILVKRPETRNQKPETTNQKPETTNQKPETTNQKQNAFLLNNFDYRFPHTARRHLYFQQRSHCRRYIRHIGLTVQLTLFYSPAI